MAKSSSGQSGSGASGGRQRSVTIDLPAEEVARAEPSGAAKGDAAAPGGETPKAEAPGTSTPEAKAAATKAPEAKAEAVSAQPTADTPSADTPTADADRKPAEEKAAASAVPPVSGDRDRREPPRREPPPPPPPPRREPPSFGALIVAALIGGVMVTLVVIILALTGFFRLVEKEGPDLAAEIETLKGEIAAIEPGVTDADLAPLRDRLAALETSFADLQATSAEAGADAAALEALGERVTQLEESLSQIGSTAPVAADGTVVALDVSGLESGLDALRQQVETLTADLASQPDADRVAAIETRLDAIGVDLDAVARFAPAVVANTLSDSIAAGRPFAAELAALGRLGVDADALAGLEPYAADGLPTRDAIRARFETEIAAVDLTAPAPEGASALDRLLGSARGLVEVRPADPTAGSDPAAVVTRIRGALASGDFETALAEWEALPEGVKAETSDWAEILKTRVAADDLVATLRADALARLSAER